MIARARMARNYKQFYVIDVIGINNEIRTYNRKNNT